MQIGQLQAPDIPMPQTEDELRQHNFLIKAQEQLNNNIPKFSSSKLPLDGKIKQWRK
ncbi:MAG: hypothetical protein GY696_26325 [Gammaproteobacteria bacterium]|nr:hypothetical protein [Gammaproteobacteria bacterium]